ncbi:biotin-dependent carboxyltransferase family protein [Xinfangfangia sp. D13-10-4-6]|uniref:5-oxoprolinase subunit C family protein n=1 Tax=Pseudogemmobacter hezensis TaxID=2737662 RepID=UPI001554BA78|nr:biotin-dependent carboxyltransferase family protein [Pseudogemmobacter hezensis]NPD17507.1 biotin-dependent carboxyltransferase family protein [Pseudogemmobacter hezensis]
MADAQLRITFAGPHVSLQDGGRPGWARFGVPQSGAMDRVALAAANTAIGNPAGATVIEISRGGLHLECLLGEVGFSLAGGGFILEHGSKRCGSWRRGQLCRGEKLVIRPGLWGSWCYLAFSGDFDRPAWLGSQATHGPSGLGGGRLLSGEELRIANAKPQRNLPAVIPCPVFARARPRLRIVPGPQERFFGTEALDALHHGKWSTTGASDRMGTRLSGPFIAPSAQLNMASEPLSRGSVQVAGDGVATILMADHQTTGGYPRIATVLDCDLDGFAQTTPMQSIQFVTVAPSEAINLSRQHISNCDRYIQRLGMIASG